MGIFIRIYIYICIIFNTLCILRTQPVHFIQFKACIVQVGINACVCTFACACVLHLSTYIIICLYTL